MRDYCGKRQLASPIDDYCELETKCLLFEFCNCKTAMCRVYEPDESCYWYRYFEKLIKLKEKKIDFSLK